MIGTECCLKTTSGITGHAISHPSASAWDLSVESNMKKRGFAILLCLAMAGCAAHKTMPAPTTAPVAAILLDRVQMADYQESPAPALVFDPPSIADEPPLLLSRDDRRPAAFVGFDGPITTYYWIHTDDRQDNSGRGLNGGWGGAGSGWGGTSGDTFQRDAQFDQIGVSTR
jgi:hypothetical protein